MCSSVVGGVNDFFLELIVFYPPCLFLAYTDVEADGPSAVQVYLHVYI